MHSGISARANRAVNRASSAIAGKRPFRGVYNRWSCNQHVMSELQVSSTGALSKTTSDVEMSQECKPEAARKKKRRSKDDDQPPPPKKVKQANTGTPKSSASQANKASQKARRLDKEYDYSPPWTSPVGLPTHGVDGLGAVQLSNLWHTGWDGGEVNSGDESDHEIAGWVTSAQKLDFGIVTVPWTVNGWDQHAKLLFCCSQELGSCQFVCLFFQVLTELWYVFVPSGLVALTIVTCEKEVHAVQDYHEEATP